MTSLRERLNNLQIVILRTLMKQGGNLTPVTLPAWQREAATKLWRRGLVEVWFRKSRDGCAGFGPFFSLTIVGPPADIEVRDITCVAEVSDEAVKVWESAPWK